MLWYPVGWTAGYLVLLVLVAAPLRRSRRLHAARLRRGPAGLARRARASARCWWSRSAGSTCCRSSRAPALTLRSADRRARRGSAPVIVGVVVLANVTSRRDAQHHLRAGLPVLAQADRAARPGRGAAGRLGRRRSPAPGRVGGAGAWSMPLGDGRRGGPLRHLLADHRDVPRHHGAAARGGPLLHQPRRPGGPPYDARGARPARRSSTCCRRSTARSAGSTRPSWPAPGARTRWCSSCRGSWSTACCGELLTGLVTAGAFAAFLSTSSGLAIAVAGVLSQDVTARGPAARRGRGVPARRRSSR